MFEWKKRKGQDCGKHFCGDAKELCLGDTVFKMSVDIQVEKLISSCEQDTQNRGLDLDASALFKICHTG